MQLYNKTIKYVTKFTLVLNKNVRELAQIGRKFLILSTDY